MFYDRFYELCQKKGVTPAKVSRDVGIGQSTIAMWKIQGTTPNAKTVAALARYFGVSQYYLLTGKTTVSMGGFKNSSPDDSEFTDENAEKQLAKLHQYGEMAKELDRMNGVTEDPYVAIACAVPSFCHEGLISNLEKAGISSDHITKESPRAAIMGEGFIIDFLTKEQQEIAIQVINDYFSSLKNK